jgi:hypothetical protein
MSIPSVLDHGAIARLQIFLRSSHDSLHRSTFPREPAADTPSGIVGEIVEELRGRIFGFRVLVHRPIENLVTFHVRNLVSMFGQPLHRLCPEFVIGRPVGFFRPIDTKGMMPRQTSKFGGRSAKPNHFGIHRRKQRRQFRWGRGKVIPEFSRDSP